MDYNENFLDVREILNNKEKQYLEDISKKYQIKHLFAKRNIDDISIDFAYSNAKIEGCTYTYAEAQTLILTGKTANNKAFSDAQMILNLKDTYIFIIENKDNIDISSSNIKNIHKLVMKNLLQDNELGYIRQIPVRIGGSAYIPETDKNILETSLNAITLNASKYNNAFERSIYLHNNLAYLQYFTDGNKRISRVIQASVLINNNKMPLFYLDNMVDNYKASLVQYYESGNYNDYKDFFINNYEASLESVVKFLKIKPKKDIEI